MGSFWFLVRLKTPEEQFKREQKGNENEVDRWVDEVQTKTTTTKNELEQRPKTATAEGVDKQPV